MVKHMIQFHMLGGLSISLTEEENDWAQEAFVDEKFGHDSC